MSPRLRFAAGLVAVLATAAGALALLLHVIATPWQYVLAVTAGAHYAMWAAPVGLAVALGLRRWRTAGVAALVTVGVVAVQVPPNLAAAASGPTRAVVLQANLRVGSADPAALVRIVRARHVDLLATEELTTGEQQRLVGAGLARTLPYRFSRPLPDGGGGLAIWSRYPVTAGRDVPGFWLGVLTARVALPGGAITFAAVHLTPPYPYPVGRWRREIARLRSVLPHEGTVLAAGDFNATVDHRQFRALLDHGYADAAEQSGAGYLPTYPNDRWYGPLIGIDHVLLRGPVRAADARTLEVPGSDHRALLVRVTARA